MRCSAGIGIIDDFCQSYVKKRNPSTFLFMIALTLLSCQTSPPIPPTAEYNHDYSGTYHREYGSCTLKVNQQAVMKTYESLGEIREPFGKVSFELFCSRGAPSYNMGYAADTILFAPHPSNIGVWSSPYGDCHLVFEFSVDNVAVSQIGYAADCGFGGNIFANGTYSLEDSSLPQLGCMNANVALNPCMTNP